MPRPLLSLGVLAVITLVAAMPLRPGWQASSDASAPDLWEVSEGLSLRTDATGFHLPSAIAVVPHPGSGPKSPRYFVTELRGTVKVVTNDRSVYTFAQNFIDHRPAAELPEMEGESGLAGICLDPARGFVFVTFVYHDSAGVLRNDIARFEVPPDTFALKAAQPTRFTGLLAPFASFISHQIGSCRVSGEHLYVTLGDGRQTARSQDTTALLGKMLRLTLDGRPAPGNPFPNAGAGAAVWAYGFRNPFGATVVNGQPYVADNGSGVDRFIRVARGRNYLWDGTDRSMALSADVVLTRSLGPGHIEYVDSTTAALPDSLRSAFLVALSRTDAAGILRIPYDVGLREPLGVPRVIARYRGEGPQIVAALAVTPEAVLFAPMLPDESGTSPVLALAHDSGAAHSRVILDDVDAQALIESRSCLGCHQLGGRGGIVGPPLDRDSIIARLRARMESEEYQVRLAALDTLHREGSRLTSGDLEALRRSTGHEQLVLWTRAKLLDPRFENPNSGMPDPGLTRGQATVLAEELVGPPTADTDGGIVAAVWSLVPRPPRVRHLALFGLAGFAGGVITVLAVLRFRRLGRPRNA